MKNPHPFANGNGSLFPSLRSVNGNAQAATIERELQRLLSCDLEAFGDLSDVEGVGGAGLGENTVVLAYVTEGIFGIPGMMDALAKALARPDDVTVEWIAETDMRHGWSEFMAANPNNSGWQDAVSHSCRLIPAKYYEKGAVRPGTFDRVIPFYKDKAFRDVSLQCIIERMGAVCASTSSSPDR